MSSARNAFGLRIASWYAALFAVSAIAIVALTYAVAARTLAERDHQILRSTVAEYAGAYARGGLRLLANTVQAEQAVAPERLFVRVYDRGVESLVLSNPQGWDLQHVEFESAQLDDGTLVQVGKSNEPRVALLERLRVALGLMTLLILVFALAGGWLATESAMGPIRSLTHTVRRIIETGRPDARVPLAPLRRGDAIDELGLLFNTMLDRIQRLVEAMRGSLDNVAHDLRTPLARLRSRAELALTQPADTERYREALAECVEETDRTLTMLDTLMDISEAESGAMQLVRQPADLREVVERAVELYRDVADANGVSLSVATPAAVVVLGDRTRLEQVAANLLDNALKYTPRGGRVDVELAPDGDGGVLEIRDTGRGIPADELPRIWERLFRGDRSRGERGLGLGLSLVKAIVEAHGGRVTVTSQPDHGSTFTVRLPLAGAPNLSPM